MPADFKEIAGEGELTVYKRSQAKNNANVQTSVSFVQSTKTPEELSGRACKQLRSARNIKR